MYALKWVGWRKKTGMVFRTFLKGFRRPFDTFSLNTKEFLIPGWLFFTFFVAFFKQLTNHEHEVHPPSSINAGKYCFHILRIIFSVLFFYQLASLFLQSGIIIPDPYFYIPDPGSKRSRIQICSKEYKYFLPKKLFLSSRKSNDRDFCPSRIQGQKSTGS